MTTRNDVAVYRIDGTINSVSEIYNSPTNSVTTRRVVPDGSWAANAVRDDDVNLFGSLRVSHYGTDAESDFQNIINRATNNINMKYYITNTPITNRWCKQNNLIQPSIWGGGGSIGDTE